MGQDDPEDPDLDREVEDLVDRLVDHAKRARLDKDALLAMVSDMWDEEFEEQ